MWQAQQSQSPSWFELPYNHTIHCPNILKELVVHWLALHSRPLLRDGFLLAYNMWCWNPCWFWSKLSFPVGFSSNWKKEAPIGVPGTSITSVPTLIDEGINTYTYTFGNQIYLFYIYCIKLIYIHTVIFFSFLTYLSMRKIAMKKIK